MTARVQRKKQWFIGSISGTVGGNTTVESVQDEFSSEGRGYSAEN